KLIGNDSQWTEDKIEVLNKGNNFTILTNISIQCFPCCPPYYKTHRERQNYFYDWEKNRIGEYGFYIGISVFLINSPELSVFFVFRCKSLYDIHACNMLLHESIQAGHGVSHPVKGPVNTFLEIIGGYDQYGKWDQANQCKPPVGPEHDAQYTGNGQKVCYHRYKTIRKDIIDP